MILLTRKNLLAAQFKADQVAAEPDTAKLKTTEAQLLAAKRQVDHLLKNGPYASMLQSE